MNVVFLGDLSFLLLSKIEKLPARFRVWAPSVKYSRFLQYWLGLAPEQVHILPRSIFFKAQPRVKVDFDSFVFAGRASLSTKRVRLAVQLVERLRHVSKKNYEFHICNTGQVSRDQVVKLFPRTRYPWIHYHFSLNRSWPQNFLSAAYLSLSHYEFEDLGIAPCEAISAGMPCILSDWGGYSDFDLPSVLKLPTLQSWTKAGERRYVIQLTKNVLDFIEQIRQGVIQTPPEACSFKELIGNQQSNLTFSAIVLARLRKGGLPRPPGLHEEKRIPGVRHEMMASYFR
ncbi:MAG: glycosyltransferase [Pseudobdellovibrionaceae bacterium]|jgi:hypothetical protein